jgi:hypothetical protein
MEASVMVHQSLKNFFSRGLAAAVLLSAFTLACPATHAQTVTGSVRGTVVDKSGAAVVGAEVAARNVNTGVVNRTSTDRSGAYNI